MRFRVRGLNRAPLGSGEGVILKLRGLGEAGSTEREELRGDASEVFWRWAGAGEFIFTL